MLLLLSACFYAQRCDRDQDPPAHETDDGEDTADSGGGTDTEEAPCRGTEAISGDLALADADLRITTPRTSTWSDAETVLAVGGDVDADGVGEVAIGVPGLNVVFLTDGAPCGALDAGFGGTAVFSYTDDEFGATVAWARGADDADLLVVGARDRVYGLTPTLETAWSADTASRMEAEVPGTDGALAGWNDGATALVAVGAPWEGGTGAVYLFDADGGWGLTAADAVATLTSAVVMYVGTAIADVGDLDGDGINELAVTAQGYADYVTAPGTVYVVTGPVAGAVDLDTAAAATIKGEFDDGFGEELGGGDLDGDGYSDLVASGRGFVATFAGPVASGSRADARATLTGDDFGDTLALPGDVDGDGTPELLVGAPQMGEALDVEPTGGAWLLRAPEPGTWAIADAATAWLGGEQPSDYAGWSVAGGDLDRDGLGEIIVGGAYFGTSYEEYDGNPDAPVFVLYGR